MWLGNGLQKSNIYLSKNWFFGPSSCVNKKRLDACRTGINITVSDIYTVLLSRSLFWRLRAFEIPPAPDKKAWLRKLALRSLIFRPFNLFLQNPGHCLFKGTVQRDFRPPDFFIIRTSLCH